MQRSSELYFLSKYLTCGRKGTCWSWTVESLLLLHPSRSTNPFLWPSVESPRGNNDSNYWCPETARVRICYLSVEQIAEFTICEEKVYLGQLQLPGHGLWPHCSGPVLKHHITVGVEGGTSVLVSQLWVEDRRKGPGSPFSSMNLLDPTS